ncbi:hypothetical protein [Sediminibacter sp. Hel_I_10]|uniref:HYC_CC_PP family protein n=1 Tax=Sediminibacter sp. Hel_I_10 TaxID=1392490 RepID=UPI00047875B9|nr:hypothetical protein [Sediminibacter sp. Hel_I_10]
MNGMLHKSFSVVMALIVLCSTVSFTVQTHFCGKRLVDMSVFNKAATCGMELQKGSTANSCEFSKKNCCNDEQVIVKGQDQLQLSFEDFSFEQQLFITTFIYSYHDLFEDATTHKASFGDYPPPFYEQDIQVLYQTFLI